MDFVKIGGLQAALTGFIDKIYAYHLDKFHVNRFVVYQSHEASDFVAGSHPIVGVEFESLKQGGDFSLYERGPKFGGIVGYLGILMKENANFTEVLSALRRHNHFAVVSQLHELLDQLRLD